jgi:hypothetical protein
MYEQLQGGELAASFTPAQRMDMVQKGYNPLDPEDVQRYKKGQKPLKSLVEVAGANKYQNLGGGTIDGADRALIQDAGIDIDAIDISSPTTNLREHVNKQISSSYGSSGTIDLNEKLAARLNITQSKQTNSNVTPKVELTETKAQQLGYALGVKYINAFIDNIKTPTPQNRARVEEELKKIKLAENKIPKQFLQHYRNGVSLAEKELYNKIKK